LRNKFGIDDFDQDYVDDNLRKKGPLQNNSLNNLSDTDKTIDELLSEGYQGVNYELTENNAFIATANHFAEKTKWIKTSPDADGDVGLMTLDVEAFDELLDFMLDKFGWCPKVYSNKSAPEIYIFTPENELEEMAIKLTTEGESGWKLSLYRLAYVDKYKQKIGFIFATKPEDSEEQDWLLVQFDLKNKTRSWSVHDGTLEQVYYLWAEEINIPEPNYNPTPEQNIRREREIR
jgi:serine/threonine-protein kinase